MTVDPLRLDRLQANTSYFDKEGRPTAQFQLFIQKAWGLIEANINGIAAAQQAADDANAAAAAADAAAVAADAAAVAAQGAAATVTADSSLSNSYATGLTMTATDAGADVTIAISGHTRVYGDGSSVAVTGGSLTALSYSTAYWCYYDDASRLGGAVTYVASTSAQGNVASLDRHFVGAVTTPAAAGPPAGGNVVQPPGYQVP